MTETKTAQERYPQKPITGMAAWLPLEDGSSTQQHSKQARAAYFKKRRAAAHANLERIQRGQA